MFEKLLIVNILSAWGVYELVFMAHEEDAIFRLVVYGMPEIHSARMTGLQAGQNEDVGIFLFVTM